MTVAELIDSNSQSIERYEIFIGGEMILVSNFNEYVISKYGNEKVYSWQLSEGDFILLEICLD